MLATFKKLSPNYEKEYSGGKEGILPYLPKGRSSCEISTGRSAFAHFIKRLPLTQKDTVLMPAYVAEGVITSFHKFDIPIQFYKLLPDLMPDLEDIRENLEKNHSIRLIIVIHPFGFEAPIDSIKELAAKREIFVLEDCAHGLFSKYSSGESFGTKGDFVLFSLNKFLPVPDGAILLSHTEKVNVSLSANEIQPNDREAMEHYMAFLEANYRLSQIHMAEKAKPVLLEAKENFDKYYARVNANLAPSAQSSFSKLVQHSIDYPSFIDHRKRNLKYLYENLKNPKLRFLNRDYQNAFSFAVPVLVPEETRDSYVQKLLEKGVLLTTLVARWNFVPAGQAKTFMNEVRFMRSHILIRVDESLSLEDMYKLVAILNEVV